MDTARLTRILAEEDPLKLIAAGAPAHEYRAEAAWLETELGVLLPACLTRVDVDDTVWGVFDQMCNFADDGHGGKPFRLKRPLVGRESLRTSVDRIYAEMVK